MKTIFLFMVLLSFTLCTIAQKKNMDDVIYLKNGSKIKGTILQLFPDSIVRIEQVGGSIWVFSMKEIAMIDKEEKFKLKANITEAKGYRFGIDAGVLIGSGDNQNNAPLSLQMIHSYHITPATAFGIGTGLEFFHTTQVPLFADIRHYFNRKYYAPFLFLQGGAMIPIGSKETDYTGSSYKEKIGFMVNSGFGFIFPMSEKSAFSISLSYRYHELKFSRDNSQLPDYMRIEKMNRFNLRFGFILQ